MEAFLGLITSIKIFDKWASLLWVAYGQFKMKKMKVENANAIMVAFQNQNQIPLESALGNPNPGQASGDAGAVVVDDVPGVLHDKGTDKR